MVTCPYLIHFCVSLLLHLLVFFAITALTPPCIFPILHLYVLAYVDMFFTFSFPVIPIRVLSSEFYVPFLLYSLFHPHPCCSTKLIYTLYQPSLLCITVTPRDINTTTTTTTTLLSHNTLSALIHYVTLIMLSLPLPPGT